MFIEAGDVISLITDHLERRPVMESRDVYKLLYQGVRGPEHIITSPSVFAERLKDEWNALNLAKGDPLWESIRSDGRLMRLNLRPYKAIGGCLDELAEACLETLRWSWGTSEDLRAAWENFRAASRETRWPGASFNDIDPFTSWLEKEGFPAVHHSEGYRRLYRPAYRLVAAETNLYQRMQT
jgi:hypothetical protein